jgi:hypothetical protein
MFSIKSVNKLLDGFFVFCFVNQTQSIILMKKFSFLFLFLISFAQAQNSISGEVKDGVTGKPLSFSSIKINDLQTVVADALGKFSNISIPEKSIIKVSYVGYETITITSDSRRFYLLLLLPSKNSLTEVNVFHTNAANAIIQKVITSKNLNNPEKRNKNFDFKAYNKLIVTANPDSINGKIDTLFLNKDPKKGIKKIDSSAYKFKKMVAKQHLFETEKVSEFQFANGTLKETVLGTKMAGFKQPVYEVLGFSLQSFSIYKNEYELFLTRFESPISKNALRKYTFKLLDTVKIQQRETLLIYFKSKSKQKDAGLEGVLFIDNKSFAIAKAIMRIRGVLDISDTHEFEFLEKENLWFPNGNTFKIVKGKNDDDIKILGGTIAFDGDVNEGFSRRKKEPSDFVYLVSETKNFEIQYDVPVIIKRKYVSIDVLDNASNRTTGFWDFYRKDSLDARSERTYLYLDSVSVKKRIEKKVIFGRKVINGFVPINQIDLDLRKFFNFNNYEGFRLCLAGVTNENFSKRFRLEGYTAFGTKDGNFKYNFGSATRLGKNSSTWVGASYTNDIQEIASTTFAVENRQFKLFDTSLINLSSFYNYISWKAFVETKIIPKTESIWELTHSTIDPKFDYLFNANNNLYRSYKMTTALLSLQWSPFSDYIQTPNGKLENTKRFPKFTLQTTKSLPNLIKNDFDFLKIDFKTEYEKKYLDGQLTNIIFSMGFALGDVPITHLYNNSPNSLNKSGLLQRFTIDGDNDFETMYFNEFFSNQFAFFQFKHEFRRFVISKKIKPVLVFITRMAIGSMSKPEQHLGIIYKTLEKGYLESGIGIDKIYKGLGLGVFYRYGPNQLPHFDDNLAIRFSYKLDFGF